MMTAGRRADDGPETRLREGARHRSSPTAGLALLGHPLPKPPVVELRFTPLEPLGGRGRARGTPGVRQPPSPQPELRPLPPHTAADAEDCLYLNVTAPFRASGRPVLFLAARRLVKRGRQGADRPATAFAFAQIHFLVSSRHYRPARSLLPGRGGRGADRRIRSARPVARVRWTYGAQSPNSSANPGSYHRVRPLGGRQAVT